MSAPARDHMPFPLTRFPSQNIIQRLQEREAGLPFRSATSSFHYTRRLYQNVSVRLLHLLR